MNCNNEYGIICALGSAQNCSKTRFSLDYQQAHFLLEINYLVYSGDSEIRPSLDFEWSKTGWVVNGLDFEWDL